MRPPPRSLRRLDTTDPRPTSVLLLQNTASTLQSPGSAPPEFSDQNVPGCSPRKRSESHPTAHQANSGQRDNTEKAVQPLAQLRAASPAPTSGEDGTLPDRDFASTSPPQCAHAWVAFSRNTMLADTDKTSECLKFSNKSP